MIVRQVPEMSWQAARFVRCGCGITSVLVPGVGDIGMGSEQHLGWWAGYENRTIWWTIEEAS